MGDVMDAALQALEERIGGSALDGVARFAIKGEGTIIVDSNGARAEDGEADVTLTADAETFRALLNGDLSPTAAFMQGRLAVDGDMTLAIQLGSAIA